MLDLTSFTLKDMAVLEAVLRQIGPGAGSMEAVAGRIVRYLHGGLVDKRSGKGSCALVRLFKTHRQGSLPLELRGGACHGTAVTPATKCFVLLATAGDQPAWNSTALSVGHKAIPLTDPETVAKIPMMADLFRQFGIESAPSCWPESGTLVEPGQKTFNVFHVSAARGSQQILQDEFVIPFDIESALGVGGMLPSGDLFALILFSKIPIPRAELTRRIAAEMERERFIGELKEALASVRTLRGLLPICAWCKRVRDDKGYWTQVETYVTAHSAAQFTHGMCPDCARKLEEADEIPAAAKKSDGADG